MREVDYFPRNFINNLAILYITIFFTLIILYFWVSKPCFCFEKKQYNELSSYVNNKNLPIRIRRDGDEELEEALRRASSMGKVNKTVIITVVNKAYVDKYPAMFDLFLEGFWVGEGTLTLLDNLVVVAMDQTAYRRCKFRRLNCYRLVTGDDDAVAEEKLYMSADFINMMWTRTLFLLRVLKRGYNFIFTDTDVIWLRNPFPYLNLNLNLNGTVDLQISVDRFNGDPRSEWNPMNTGFYHIRSNNKTIALFETWYDSRTEATELKEQDVLEKLIRSGLIRRLGLTVRFLDTLYFSGFCSSDTRDVTTVSTIHANCCRGMGAKITDLTAVLKDWIRFKRPPPAVVNDGGGGDSVVVRRNDGAENEFEWSGHDACASSWEDSAVTRSSP